MRHFALPALLTALIAHASHAANAAELWYVNPYLGGITPDKPWGATGSAPLNGIDVGAVLSARWSAELDMNGATPRDRADSGHSGLYGVALQAVRVFRRDAVVAPYLALGAGVTRFAPATPSSLEARTEFMWQAGGGAAVRLWQRADGSRVVALRPDIKVRWTHGWAHAPGNPLDPLYGLGLTYSF
jgi:hypothetical protein